MPKKNSKLHIIKSGPNVNGDTGDVISLTCQENSVTMIDYNSGCVYVCIFMYMIV
jgi:hypothetical protein